MQIGWVDPEEAGCGRVIAAGPIDGFQYQSPFGLGHIPVVGGGRFVEG